MFSFRDSFQGPVAVFYDPVHMLSSQTVNTYDLFHLLRNYHLSPPMIRGLFEKVCQPTELVGDFYLRSLRQRDSRLTIELVYDSDDEREAFERKWCCGPVALAGIRLQVRDNDGVLLAGGLDEQMTTAVAKKYLPMLIIPPDDVGAMIARVRIVACGPDLSPFAFLMAPVRLAIGLFSVQPLFTLMLNCWATFCSKIA